MEETLHTRVIGQEEAVVAISRAIRRARVGLKNPNRPIASFIFSGPTGACPFTFAPTEFQKNARVRRRKRGRRVTAPHTGDCTRNTPFAELTQRVCCFEEPSLHVGMHKCHRGRVLVVMYKPHCVRIHAYQLYR